MDDLLKINKWNAETINQIIADNGSVQQLGIPDELKKLYRMSWEISQKAIIDQAAGRQPFVSMSQSMNLFVAKPSLGKVTSAIFYAWSRRLKTLVYYLRSLPKAETIKFTVDRELADKTRTEAAKEQKLFCTREDIENGCESCSG